MLHSIALGTWKRSGSEILNSEVNVFHCATSENKAGHSKVMFSEQEKRHMDDLCNTSHVTSSIALFQFGGRVFPTSECSGTQC